MTSRRLASGERQESLINPRELTEVSDWGERTQPTQRQLEG
ncbi:addiction module toxin RelE [Pluralibacter gergoviae]|nr:addiction module toxin RelE [Pluralibacter gergoviae]